jgi:tRNA threonylcarbamoyladenosine biosynthesis protein TsaE
MASEPTPTFEWLSSSPEQTRQAGRLLGAHLQPGDVVCLIGDLGAGKTTFVQGIAAGWGSPDQANSPTFVLVNVYRRPDKGRLYHLDTYRLSGPQEAEDLDLDTLIESGPLLVEWADRILPALPAQRLWVHLHDAGGDLRSLSFAFTGERYEEYINSIRKLL